MQWAEVKDFHGIFSASPCPLRLIWSLPPRPASGRVAVLSASHETQRTQRHREKLQNTFIRVCRDQKSQDRTAPVEVGSDLHASARLFRNANKIPVALLISD